ncbi:hypothetical protein [Streptomyces sp900116325]|uniref:hypothetical protein n=1 Tax=Streptomyces sp. 900116325 TaxID=3154295 RepID=UPI0033FD7192
MLERDLAEPDPHVSKDDRGADAARLLAGQQLSALLVPDMDQRPYAMVTGSQFLKQPAPDYVLEDPHVAAVIDDRHLAEVTEDIAGRTVSEWLPPRTYTRLDAGALQVAADRWSLPPSATGDQVRLVGALTAARLTERLIGEL